MNSVETSRNKSNSMVENRKGNSYRTPPVDVFENSAEYVLYFDVPGVEKDDIDLTVEQNSLSLLAECRKSPGDGYQLLRDELVYSGFRRKFDLGDTVDPGKISAEYRNGTLKVVLPKQESQKPQRISIGEGK